MCHLQCYWSRLQICKAQTLCIHRCYKWLTLQRKIILFMLKAIMPFPPTPLGFWSWEQECQWLAGVFVNLLSSSHCYRVYFPSHSLSPRGLGKPHIFCKPTLASFFKCHLVSLIHYGLYTCISGKPLTPMYFILSDAIVNETVFLISLSDNSLLV